MRHKQTSTVTCNCKSYPATREGFSLSTYCINRPWERHLSVCRVSLDSRRCRVSAMGRFSGSAYMSACFPLKVAPATSQPLPPSRHRQACRTCTNDTGRALMVFSP